MWTVIQETPELKKIVIELCALSSTVKLSVSRQCGEAQGLRNSGSGLKKGRGGPGRTEFWQWLEERKGRPRAYGILAVA